ncbi:transporter [Sphingomonas sp. 1P08PE]|uniref:transporter n=1 Tax=Sphingomonas sp. 1P08PE TaxID=554122 RepID=UPI00399FFC3F
MKVGRSGGTTALAGLSLALAGAPAAAQTRPTATIQAELEQARAEIAAQRRQLEAQEARLRALEARIGGSAQVAGSPVGPAAGPTQPARSVAQASAASTPGDPASVVAAAPSGPIESVGARPVNSDRPPEVAVLGSEGSVVTRKGQLTGEFQVDYARADRNRALFRGIEIVESVLVGEFNINESRQDIVTASLAARYGLTDRLELGVRLPFVQRWDTSVLVPVQGSTSNDAAREIDSSAQGRGLGDIEMSARYQLLTGRAGLPYLVGNLQVVAPTGSNPFDVPRLPTGEATKAATGAGFWGASPSITAILPSDPAVLFGTIGYTHNFGRSVDTVISPVRITYVKPGDAISFSAGIGISLNERTSMNLGYAQTWAFGTRTRTELLDPGPMDPPFLEDTSRDLQLGRFLFGVTYRATDRASINWSVEVGATDDAADVRSVLRVPLILIAP